MPNPVKKNSLFPIAYDEVSLVDEGAAGSAHVLIAKRDSKSVSKKKKLVGPGVKDNSTCEKCKAASAKNSTGKKDGKSKRSQHWEEARHPRDEKGKMKESSSESKAAHGKGGTTQAKLEASCKSCKKKKKGKKQSFSTPIGKTNQPTAMSRWDSEAHIRALMERK